MNLWQRLDKQFTLVYGFRIQRITHSNFF